MAKALGGLLVRFGRRRTHAEGPPDDAPAVDADAMALESAPVGPPILVPAAIFRQLLFDAAELTPAWARPRPAPVPDPEGSSGPIVDKPVVAKVAPTDAPKPTKRTRRPKPNGSSGASRPRASRVAKPDHGATDG
ncbi:MAG TPA: hypothetical protein VGQ64_00555 [Candidatus Limnocylindrales bacterium]|jgi:hypothetical protein|nr:hypothetical protein [Candidatus Limnocylindrales bacterium]